TERLGVREQRRRLMDGLTGRVVEIGAGTGLNVPLYPTTADEVHALEPDQHMVERLIEKATDSPVPLFLYRGDAHNLPFSDGVFDAAIITFALCTIPEPVRALDEAHRVVRSGGMLRFLEHVRSPNVRTARWQDRINPIWGKVSGGCRLNQPTVDILEATHWEIDDVWRSGGGFVAAGQAFRT
ncbi:MAG: class I SAM-dependent methyltransferase, partial [Actinomycetia bacterium]|nr:class I SAM-dependent methyltransferase [Actinomycetes bacterium]